MNQPDNGLSRALTIVNELGLHARSAAKIAAVAKNAVSTVWIANDYEKVDAASTLDILTLGCAKGQLISVTIESPEDLAILEEITTLVKSGFGE